MMIWNRQNYSMIHYTIKRESILSPEIGPKPIVFEVFTQLDDEIKGDSIIADTGWRSKIRGLLGEELYSSVRSLVKGKGTMGVDTGSNKSNNK
jgi:hypothetical protein